jgi:hypothetical protein
MDRRLLVYYDRELAYSRELGSELADEWLDIPESQAWRLGRRREQSTLGESTLVGRRVLQARAEHPCLRLGQSGRLGRDAWLQAAKGRTESSRRPLGSNRTQDLLIDPRAAAATAVAASSGRKTLRKSRLAAGYNPRRRPTVR